MEMERPNCSLQQSACLNRPLRGYCVNSSAILLSIFQHFKTKEPIILTFRGRKQIKIEINNNNNNNKKHDGFWQRPTPNQ